MLQTSPLRVKNNRNFSEYTPFGLFRSGDGVYLKNTVIQHITYDPYEYVNWSSINLSETEILLSVH